MSTETLSNLRDYLYGTLTPSNMLWLAEQLTAYARQEQQKSYTMEEINARIDEAERQITAGLSQDSEDMFQELEKELLQEMNIKENSLPMPHRGMIGVASHTATPLGVANL
ncbi:MAG: hypothetical protein IJT97_01665 [Bacteroidaceae bacterium]|nr:hypothetical protein [Bacteroidaceae bacterium]